MVGHEPPVDELTDEFPIRLTTGRRLDSYNTGVQSGGFASPLRHGETIDLSPGRRRRASASTTASWCGSSSRRGSMRGAGADRPGLRPGLAFMTFHFPDEVDTNLLTIEAIDPEVGHGRVQGDRHPGREGRALARPAS